MKLTLERTWCGAKCTIGTLRIGDTYECFTLEDVVRKAGEPKVPGATAIPEGEYKVVITPSNRFKRDLPLLLDVPGFTGIRIHPGNTDADTAGCILVGTAKGPDYVSHSRDAFNLLFPKLVAAIAAGDPVTIAVGSA